MSPLALSQPVAVAKVKYHLAGLRGYNPMEEAVNQLARAVQSVCVSVEHADATLSHFEEQCPTPREIKDVALNLREQFLPKQPSQQEQWEKQYGPPDPQWSEIFLKAAVTGIQPKDKAWEAQKREMRLQAIRDTVYYTEGAGRAELDAIVGKQERSQSRLFWAEALRRHERDHPEELAAIRAGREPELPKPKVVPMPPPITAESFANVKPMRHETCSICGGSGRLAGDDYCECKMGIALRKLEASK